MLKFNRDIFEILHLIHAVGLLLDKTVYTLFLVIVGWKP
jgi:hypothetical protein